MQADVVEDSSALTALEIARRWIDPAAAEPFKATIRQLAEAMEIDVHMVRAGLARLVANGTGVVQRRACCAPRSALCDPGTLLDNEHFELTPGLTYLREIRTPRAVPSITPSPGLMP